MHSNTSQSPSYTYPASLEPFALPPEQFSTPEQPLVAVGAYIFTPPGISPTKVLLLRRAPTDTFPNLWEVPGGGAELADTTLLDAVVREVLEESGLVVTMVKQLLGTAEFKTRSGRVCRKHDFLVAVEEGEIKTHPAEHSEWGWFGVEEVNVLAITMEDMRKTLMAAFETVEELRGSNDGAC